MPLNFFVHLEADDTPSEDDGETAWRSTHIKLRHGGCVILADVFIDGYSGRRRANVIRDDFDLPLDYAQRLAIAACRWCAYEMAEDSVMIQSECDFEALVRWIAYHSEGQAVLRKLRRRLASTSTGATR